MSKPVLLERDFHLGVRNDVARENLPPGSAWGILNCLIHRAECPILARGMWTYNSAALTAAKVCRSVSYANFSAGAKVVAIDTAASNNLWYASPSAATGVSYTNATGTVPVPISKPFQHRDYHIIPYDGTTAVKSFDGTNIAAIATAPNGYYGCLWKDYSILAGTSAAPQRLYFSDPGDPLTWDTTNSYWDFPFPIKGVASLPSCLMVWGSSQVWRLRGSVPPALNGAPTDLVMERVGDMGLLDARTIALFQDSVIWASGSSIHISDGTTPSDLGAAAGIGDYWAHVLNPFSIFGLAASDIYQNRWYVFSYGGTAIVYEIPLRRWTLWTNVKTRSVCRIPATGAVAEQLLFGCDDQTRVGNLTPCFVAPSPSGPTGDGDGDINSCTILTRMYGLDGRRRIRRVYFDYFTGTSGSSVVTVAASLDPNADAQNYTSSFSVGTLPITSDLTTRGRLQLKRSSLLMGLQVSLVVRGGIFGIWADGHDQEGSRL